MASAIDLPNTAASGAPAGGVHLMDKRTVGRRLAAGALATVYYPPLSRIPARSAKPRNGGGGGSGVAEQHIHAGPRFINAVLVKSPVDSGASGTRVVLHFDCSSGGGAALEVRATDGFELNSDCGWGGSWVPADIVASNASSVTVEARSLIKAVGVRYEPASQCCVIVRRVILLCA